MAIQQDLVESIPDDSKRAGSFEPVEGIKEVQLDPDGARTKTARISSSLDAK